MIKKIVYIGIDLFYPALSELAGLCEIGQIVTCKTDNVTEFNREICHYAEEHHIPLKIGKITAADLDDWSSRGFDLIICGGYYHRIPIREKEKIPIVNIHPSLLPKGRGAWPMPVAILQGDTVSGITIHKMSEEFDEGDILLQKEVPIYADDNLETLTMRMRKQLPELMRQLIQDFEQLWKSARVQGEGEYLKMPEEKDWTVTSAMDCREADKILRAFWGYECIYRNGNDKFELIYGRIRREEAPGSITFPIKDGEIIADRVRKI
ncbi:MAG: hypothetical protein HDR07_07635 [Lachnospiraceae bacterium]|nr:hypothetical protein [Lachnospiraceae bacterium]